MSKKTVWFEVGENETLADCLERMKEQGYMAMGRKEEPVFEDIDGEPVPVRQIVKFKGVKIGN
ncbi:NETI motif-containing protein [Planococcus shixiaomingii]|uniref:NETI motif-containing protein n=1 Tax=Planococcus shixiaomingii TaxID=3058393 RepID=UPI002620B994|nr:NETI motif-containing protein [Planococcus sp. N022]WKA55769.1 NETI motif-containing protein [Planococcus sp. N022]